jgi:nucleoside 2-deoxyribosyltransferase
MVNQDFQWQLDLEKIFKINIMRTIYLAGPDVFRINALEHFIEMKKLCQKYGFNDLSPFDN